MSHHARVTLTDDDVEAVLLMLAMLRSGWTLEEASAAVAALQAARAAGDEDWPRDAGELERVLPPRGRQLWLVPAAWSFARSCCPTGAA